VPFIVRWPAAVKPGVSNALVSQIDFNASFAAMLNHAIDSRNMLPALLGEDAAGLPFMLVEATGLAQREGPWKFIKGKKDDELYQLETDIGETDNVIGKHPERAAAMKSRLEEIRAAKGGIRSLARR
jgi:arylsulfatase A-like enzyme